MSDLLQSQIQENCRLALPDGLKDLMADISREVLRAQPKHLYEFIADYLLALLITRKNLSIAARICNDLCNSTCHPELEEELKFIGLDEEDVEKARIVIDKYFESGAKEEKLLFKLMKKININEAQLPAIQLAVRDAFLRHRNNITDIYGVPNNMDAVTKAVHHTLDLYKQTGPRENEYNWMAQKVQDFHRGYGVRRQSRSDMTVTEAQSNITSAGTSGKSLRFELNVTETEQYTEQALTPIFSTISDSCYFHDSNKPYIFQEQCSNSSETSDPIFKEHITRYNEELLKTTSDINNVYEEKINSDDMPGEDEFIIANDDEIVIEDQVIDADDESEASMDKVM